MFRFAEQHITRVCFFRYFGLLLTPGRNVKQSDMHLLDMERDDTDNDAASSDSHSVLGIWDPSQTHFNLLNTETQKGI